MMREVSGTAVRVFDERGYDNVTMEQIAEATGVSVATLYRRFTTKENLVCWQSDEQLGMDSLVTAVQSGRPVDRAAKDLAEGLPHEAVDAIEDTARIRLRLIAGHPTLHAAAQQKGESFISAILDASADSDHRPLLEREVEARCTAAALTAAKNAWLRGEGSLRDCALRALSVVGDEDPRPGSEAE